jgi:hypothetical protein
MSEKKTTFVEEMYDARDVEPMVVVRRIMLERGTGQLTLNLGEGRINSIVWRRKIVESSNGNGHQKNSLDTASP